MATAQEAADWVSGYADGGPMCDDCQHSQPVDPGSGHICRVVEGGRRGMILEPTDCPALPPELYPD